MPTELERTMTDRDESTGEELPETTEGEPKGTDTEDPPVSADTADAADSEATTTGDAEPEDAESDGDEEPDASGDPLEVDDPDSPPNRVVSAIHQLPHDLDSDPFEQHSRGGRTIFLFVALVVAAIGVIIVYELVTQGVGTNYFSDYDAGPSRADFQAEDTPPPPPLETTATSVTSTPEGASIIVNGVAARATAPAEVELVDGAVNVISLHLEGHAPVFVEGVAGQPVEAELTPLPPPPEPEEEPEAEPPVDPAEGTGEPVDPGPGAGNGRIRVLVRDTTGAAQPAEVLFNGNPVGNAPVLLDVDAGVRHHVSARMAGMRDSSAYARAIPWVDRNSETVVTLELTGDAGDANRLTSLRVRAAPADATVLVDGERQPATGLINVDSSSHHVVHISAEDHEPLVRTVDGRLGQMTIDAVLDPIRTGPSALTLTVEPPEAIVFIERVRHGSGGATQLATPAEAVEVESGPCRITLEYRDEEGNRIRNRFDTELRPGTHHIVRYGLEDGAFVETASDQQEYTPPGR